MSIVNDPPTDDELESQERAHGESSILEAIGILFMLMGGGMLVAVAPVYALLGIAGLVLLSIAIR